MLKFKKILSLLNLTQQSGRIFLALINVLIFSIIIIVDIIAFFQERNLEFLVIITLMSGSLVAYSQAWIYGSNHENKNEVDGLTSKLKPDVRVIKRPMTEEELKENASRKMEQ